MSWTGREPQRGRGSGMSQSIIGAVPGSSATARRAQSTRPPRSLRHPAPPAPRVHARRPLDSASLVDRGFLEDGSAAHRAAARLLDRVRRESQAHAERLRDIAALWVERDDPDLCDDRAETDVAVAMALRTTTSHAATLLRDAHIALIDVPATFARLAAGDMPAQWFDRLLRDLRGLTPHQRRQVDERVSTWDLASIPVDRFRRELSTLVTWFAASEPEVAPQEKQDVALELPPNADGTACLRITGPVPEILALSRRLDAAARAVQHRQRHALEDGAAVPFDINGAASTSGRQLPLRALRYAVLTRSVLDTGGIEVPAEQFRLSVVVPVMSLLGQSDAPAVLDGTNPLPASMARMLAAEQSVWFRILTDPVDGSFLEVPATQYRPPASMREHLRLRDPVCAVPGCGRVTSSCAEADHIEEFDHENPARGGPTTLANLHHLCRLHHRLKTLGLIDPVRGPEGTITHWSTRSGARASVGPNGDLTTPDLAAALTERWEHDQWRRDLDAMALAGEFERMAREEGPAETRRAHGLRGQPPF